MNFRRNIREATYQFMISLLFPSRFLLVFHTQSISFLRFPTNHVEALYFGSLVAVRFGTDQVAMVFAGVNLQEPVVDSMKAAVDRLTHSTNFLNFLAQHALIMQEELPTSEGPVDDQRYHFMSLLLNLVNTFLYMVNTYIIVPTADDYSMSLGAAATVCGIVIGSMAVAQVFSSVYFSAWSNKSYFRPLVFSSIVLFIGNAMYALAYDFNSIAVLLLGRVFCG
jgi:hypothetical protein